MCEEDEYAEESDEPKEVMVWITGVKKKMTCYNKEDSKGPHKIKICKVAHVQQYSCVSTGTY